VRLGGGARKAGERNVLTTVRSNMRVRIGVIEMGRKSECWVGMAILGTGVHAGFLPLLCDR